MSIVDIIVFMFFIFLFFYFFIFLFCSKDPKRLSKENCS